LRSCCMPADRRPTRIAVGGERPYEVRVGDGLLGELPGLVGDDAHTVAVIHPGTLRPAAEDVRTMLAERGFRAHTVEVPDGEQAKTADVAVSCWATLGRIGMTRSDAIVGFGGGATTD